MRWSQRITAAVVVAALAGAACAAPPSPDEIRTAVKQLGDDRFAVREKAMKLLWQAGPAAEAALLDAVKGNDPEVAKRARTLLDRILYRIDPDTPKDVIDLMQRYRTGTAEDQLAVIKEMLKLGSRTHPYLLRLLEAVPDDRRRLVLEQFAFDDWKVLVPLMADGQESLVEQLLEKAANAQIDSIVPHYAAFHFVTNRLDGKIPKLRAAVEGSGGAFQAKLLAAVYRFQGDAEGLHWAAERSQQSEWVKFTLLEKGAWGELLTRYTPSTPGGLSQINGLGLLAAYQRLANRPADFEATLHKIHEYAAGPRKDLMPYAAAKALLINEQTARAIALLVEHEQLQQAAELHLAQGKYGEALALSEKAARAETGPQSQVRLVHINVLLRLGKTKEAREWLEGVAKDMATATVPAAEISWLERRIELEMRLGLKNEATQHALVQLQLKENRFLGNIFAGLFPELGVRAETLWRFLRFKHPNESAEKTLARVRQIEDRTITASDLGELLRQALPDTTWTAQPATAFEHLAFLVLRFERADLAADLLKHPNWDKAPATATITLADALADAKQWPAAAEAYHKAWESDRGNVLPHFLHGWALTQSGRAAEGKAIQERAHRMLLGSGSARYYFHAALVERGFADDARHEVRIRSRLCPPGSWDHGQAQEHAANLAWESGDYLTAAAIYERNLLRLLPTTTGYRSISGYIRATSLIHALRAKGMLASGKKAEAFAEIARAENLHGAHLDLPILLVADLERAGEKDRAAELFNRVFTLLDQNCRDFPDGADAHNQLAWLCARCRRRLDDALVHSNRAVALAPTTASYLDTLAEVHFQRGDTPKALELIKRCLKMPNQNGGFYRAQVKRFEKGDPKAEPALE